MRSLPDPAPTFPKPGRAAVATTLVVICALAAWQHFFGPWKAAPGPLLLAVLAAGAFWGGLRAGLLSATAAIAYFAYSIFSLEVAGQPGLLEQNAALFTLLSLAALVIVVLIGTLSKRLSEAVRKVAALQAAHGERKSLEDVIDASHDAVVGLTPAGIITSWNSAAERISGYTAEEIIGRHMSVMATPETVAEQAENFAQARNGQPGAVYEITRVGKDGRRMELSIYFVPTLAADGTLEAVTCMARDHTEYKRSQSALRHSEERFRQVAENLPGALWVADLQWKFLYVSPGYEAVYQRPVRDFIENQSSFLEFLHPDDLPRVVADYTNRPPGVAFEEEFRVLLPDGSVNWVRNRAFPVRAADGRVEGMTGLTANITESKRVEEALRESELRFRSLFEQLGDAYYVHDTEGHLVSVNEAACQAVGYRREELLEMDLADIDTDLDWAERPAFWQDLPAGQVHTFTRVHRRKDGTTFPVEVRLSLASREGAPRLLLGAVRDVTERQRAAELLEARARQQQAVSLLGLRALRQDAGDPDALGILFKEAVALIARTLQTDFGMVIEHLPGTDRFVFRGSYGWSDHCPTEEFSFAPDDGSLVGYTLLTKSPVVIADYGTEARFKVSGEVLESGAVSGVSVVIYGEDESIYGTLSVHDRHQRDFTADDVAFLQAAANVLSAAATRQRTRSNLQRALDEAAAARHEAERANHAKSEFLSRMSHELRTPLNAILGFGQLLQMEEGSSEMNKDCCNHVVTAGRHLLSLIDDVLDIARIESGNETPWITAVQVPEMLRNVVQLVLPSAAAGAIRLDLVASQPEDCAVDADERRLKQVLLNLLSNAIKYNASGGLVTVDWQKGSAGTLRLRVRDTGSGLTPEQIARLYAPFERLDAEQRGIPGTGLGLAVSRRLVEAMGGTLGLESAPGKGSVFWVELPMVEEVAQGDSAAAGSAPLVKKGSGWNEGPADGRTSILQIEDNPSNQRVMKMLIANQRPQWHLLSAPNARLGMELARRQRPSLILLDLQLPDLQGDEVLAMLRADRDTKQIPVVMLSADATARSRENSLAAGAVAYIHKPFDVAELLGLLDTTLAVGAGPKAAGAGMDQRARRTIRVGPRNTTRVPEAKPPRSNR